MTKQLRILSGCHAGARLNLRYGISTVGSTEQADVQISDWEGETMFLEYRSDGTATMTPPPGNVASSRIARTLLDWIPSRYGQTVLCVGPDDATWPSEVSLFERLLQTEESAKDSTEHAAAMKSATQAALGDRQQTAHANARPHGTLKKRWAYNSGAGVVIVGLIVGLMLVLTDGSSEKVRAAIRPTPVPALPVLTPAEQQKKAIENALARLHQPDVSVTPADGRIVLGGIVASAADALTIRRALQDLSTAPHGGIAKMTIDQSFAVADHIADDLQSTLGDTGLTVRYTGHGVFTVSGATHNLASMHALLARAQNDYGGRIRRIDDQMTQASTPSAGAEAMLDMGDVRYIQMPDGSKRFAPDPTPTPPAASVASVASAAPAGTGTPIISVAAPVAVKASATPLASTLPPGEAPLPSQP
ncbi:MAG: hypothetical protein ACRYHA_13920 [Janthinobacterium lividum]